MSGPDEPDLDEMDELAALADGSLDPARRAELEARVAGSRDLAAMLAEQQHAVALARTAAMGVEAPASLRARVEDLQRPRTRRRRSSRMFLAAGVAAVAIAIAAGFVAMRSAPSGPQFRVALAATSLAPGAGGEASMTRTDAGWSIYVEAHGLPRLTNGRFYQGWLRAPDGTLVPIGTFNDGNGVTLWAGVSPARFPQLIVTREHAGGQSPSGEVVLAGTVRQS
jgi:anti-sigma-K factor RskA